MEARKRFNLNNIMLKTETAQGLDQYETKLEDRAVQFGLQTISNLF